MYQFNTGKPEPVNCPMPTKPKFSSMSKIELEEYGRTIGLELDRRLTKAKLIKQLEQQVQLRKKRKAQAYMQIFTLKENVLQLVAVKK